MDVYIWGNGRYGQLGVGDDKRKLLKATLLIDPNTGHKLELIHIECGGWHTIGVTKNGQVVSWGRNFYGQLGRGDRIGSDVRPTKVEALDGRVIIKVSCGTHHTAVITDKGELLTWGCGRSGQLGHGNKDHFTTPKKVQALADEVIVDVACGERHTCAVTSTGSIFTWGSGIATGHGKFSDIPRPRLLQDLSSKGVVSVSANRYHTACVTRSGDVFTWGNGEYGRLGHGDTRPYENDQQTPKRVEALVVGGVKVKMVSCGYEHTAVCTEDGRMHTFGKGEHGRLGHGDTENQYSPAPVLTFEGKHITQVQCGTFHTMALTLTGYVFTCGDAKLALLGHGNVNLKCFSFPCLVEGLREHNVVQISCGYIHCAVLVDPTSPSPIRQLQQASFNNKEHSDVVFKVENQLLYAHIDVLTQKSDYFAAMFRSNMRESIERVVNVPNCSKAVFLHVLEYIYLDDFTVSMDDVVELWVLADMYQMEGLKYSCMGTLEMGLSEENASQMLQEVENLSCPCDELKRMCHEYLEFHAEDGDPRRLKSLTAPKCTLCNLM